MAVQPTRLARKLSAATITGLTKEQMRERCATDAGKSFPLYSIIGTARGFRTGTSQFGDWLAVTGEFEGTNLETGEVLNGGRYFPPPYVADLLTPALTAGGENAAVDFALVVGIKWADNAFGYEYHCDTYREPGETESMKTLRAMIPRPEELLGIEDQSGSASKTAKDETKS